MSGKAATVKPDKAEGRWTPEQKKKFGRDMTERRKKTQAKRELFLNCSVYQEQTIYKPEEYESLRGLSPALRMNIISRIGHLNQMLKNFKQAVLFVFLEEKVKFAFDKKATCDDEPLFQKGRQWCYLSVKTIMNTGLFNRREEAQDTMGDLVKSGIVYERKRNGPAKPGRKKGSNLVTWYSPEYLHPILLFTKNELMTNDFSTVEKVVENLHNKGALRTKRARTIARRLMKEKKIKRLNTIEKLL